MRHEYGGSHRTQRRIYGKTQLDRLARYREISCDDGAILLRLNRSALRRLDFLVREGLKTVLHADHVETGGILIGEVSPDRSVVTLLDVVAIESEYRFGPSYRPSEADLRTFAEAIAKYSSGPRSVIGYFRSHLHATVSSRAEDENLIKRFFTRGGCSIILVHADLAEKSMAWFCQWDGGENVRLLNRFPLDTAVLPAEAARPRPEPALARRPEAEAVPAAAKVERQPHGPPPSERTSVPVPASFALAGTRFRKASIATAAVIALLAIFALGRLSVPPRSAPVNDPRLELTVALHDSIAEVKWNPASPVVRDSERGALDIVDGTGVRRINLNQAQLLSGHYEYFPNQPDFTCLMTVFRNNNAFVGVTQEVHLNLPQNITPASLAERPTDRRPAPSGLPIVKSSSAQRVEDVTSGVKNSPVDPDQEPADAEAPARPRGASFTPPPSVARPTPAPRVEDPPELRTPGPSPGVSPLPVPRFPSGIAPPAPPATVASPPATAVSPPTDFSEPVPVTRVRPTLPRGSTLAIRRDVSIRVAIQIDRQGRVTGVSPLDANDLIERQLAPYALQAARLWRFNPARRDAVPVASETVVVFQFAKNL